MVAGGGDVVDESTYHGSSLDSIDLALYPAAGRWVEDYTSASAGGGDRYSYVRQAMPLSLAPFDQLIAHAKANSLPLGALRAYCYQQLGDADKHRDNPHISHVYHHWRGMLALIDSTEP
ncbi:hypothetical protein D3C83_17950 [compost metagenome]